MERDYTGLSKPTRRGGETEREGGEQRKASVVRDASLVGGRETGKA